jgi:hypothetical protein
MAKFKKISELDQSSRSKVKEYFSELYGNEYANAMVQDYKPEGEKKKVVAKKDRK